jgi:hypothetical protein
MGKAISPQQGPMMHRVNVTHARLVTKRSAIGVRSRVGRVLTRDSGACPA